MFNAAALFQWLPSRRRSRSVTMPPSVAPVSAVITENGLRHRSKARGLLNVSNLPALQNLIKRDPASYEDDFRSQWNHYESLRQLYAGGLGVDFAGGASAMDGAMNGAARVLNKEQEDKFVALLSFVTQLAPSYAEITRPLFHEISSLLLEHHAIVGKDVRSACVRSLVLMRNRDVITSEQLLRTLFPLLLASPSASLRSLLQRTITTDLRNANAKSKNHALNRVVQGLFFSVIEVGMPTHGQDSSAGLARAGYGKKDAGSKSGAEALWAVRLAADLWTKRIWNDEKTVSLLALACLHPHPRVQSSAVRFFLGDLHSSEAGDESGSEDGSDDEGGVIPDVSSLVHKRKINKKSRSNDRKVRAAASLAKKRRRALEEKKLDKDGQEGDTNVAALHMLNDPQGFGEKLFNELKRGDKRLMLDHKVRIMQLLARVMSSHQTSVLGFYSFVVKYLMPHQQHITLILVSVAQSVHSQTPPSALLPLIRKLANNFVHPGVGHEVVAAGINTIREICTRQIWSLGSEETDYDVEKEDDDDVEENAGMVVKKTRTDDGRDLLEDLISYRRSKDKGVAAASRGLLLLYRRENPKLLPRKERGKDGTIKAGDEDHTVRGFGQTDNSTHGIAGLDLLAKHLEEADSEAEEERDRKAWEGWSAESDEESDASSGGWIDVSSEGEDFNVTDSDDDDETARKKRKGNEEQGPQKTALERVRDRREAKRDARRNARLGLSEPAGADSEEEGGSDQADADGKSKASAVDNEETNEEGMEAIEKLATTRILTPADFALLNKLRLEAAQGALSSTKSGSKAQQALKKEIAQLEARRKRNESDANGAAAGAAATIVNEVDILGLRKRKMDYEERMASIEKGREGREFGSKKGKKNKSNPSSTSNADKKKSKPYMMVARSWSVRDKKNASLAQKSRRLKAAKEKQKKQHK